MPPQPPTPSVSGVAERVTEPPPLPQELLARSGFLLVRLGMDFKARALEALARMGFSQYHYSVLALLGEQAREAQAAIADTLGVDPSQLVRVLDSLEDRGLIARHRDPIDRRRHTVSVTADGRRQLRRLRETIDRLEDELLAPLDRDRRANLHALLLELANFHDPRCATDPPPD